LQRTWQRCADIDRGRIAKTEALSSAVQGCATPLNADPLAGGSEDLDTVEPEAITRLRSATAQFDFPRISYVTEHELDAGDAVGACPFSFAEVLVSTQPNPYPDLFAFWPEALRCLAEDGAGEIFRDWERLSGEISCGSVASSELVVRLAEALAPFSPSSGVPALPERFSEAYEVLGVPGWRVWIGSASSGKGCHLALGIGSAAG